MANKEKDTPDKVPVYVKMKKEIHDDLVDYMAKAKKLRVPGLKSKKRVIDKAVREFMIHHPLNKTVLPVNVEGVTETYEED